MKGEKVEVGLENDDHGECCQWSIEGNERMKVVKKRGAGG